MNYDVCVYHDFLIYTHMNFVGIAFSPMHFYFTPLTPDVHQRGRVCRLARAKRHKVCFFAIRKQVEIEREGLFYSCNC